MSKFLYDRHSPISPGVLKAHRQAVVDSWEDAGMLEGLKGASKINVAQLLESQASQMLNEVGRDREETFIEFHQRKIKECMQWDDMGGAKFHLQTLIYLLQNNIIKLYCE